MENESKEIKTAPINPSATICLRTLVAVSKFCRSGSKSNLSTYGVSIEIDAEGVNYIALDGHCLAARRVTNLEGSEPNTLIGKWVIHSKDCRLLKISSCSDGLGKITPNFDWLQIEYGNTVVNIKPYDVEGSFPDWRRVLPRPVDGTLSGNTTFNFLRLADIHKFGRTLGLGLLQTHWNGPGKATPFTWSRDDNTFCVLMPMHQNEPDWSIPDWVK